MNGLSTTVKELHDRGRGEQAGDYDMAMAITILVQRYECMYVDKEKRGERIFDTIDLGSHIETE